MRQQNPPRFVFISITVLIILSILSTGCAYKYLEPIESNMDGPPASLIRDLGPYPVITIEYPVAIDDTVEQQVIAAYIDNDRENSFSMYQSEFKQIPLSTCMITINKFLTRSHYMALELAARFRERMGEHAVVLRPVTLSYERGEIIQKTAVQTPQTPITLSYAVRQIILADHRSVPHTGTNGGPWISHFITIQDRTGSGSNHIGSYMYFNKAGDAVAYDYLQYLNGINQNNDGRMPKAVLAELGTPLQKRPAGPGKTISLSNNSHGMAWYGLEKQQLETYATYDYEPDNSPLNPLWDKYVNVVIEYLNNSPSTEYKSLAEYRALLGLGAAVPSQQVLAALRSETKFLSQQDQKYSSTMLAGEFGKSVRQMMVAEQNQIDNYRAAQNQMAGTMLMNSVTSLSGTLAAHQGKISATQNLALQQQVLTMNLNAARTNAATQAQVKNQFFQHFNRILDAQTTVSIEVGTGEQEIRADGLADLRKKMAAVLEQASR